jgi:hypothetical protein
MKFALVNGERQESEPGLTAACPMCERPVIAKCGSLRVWHWAHKGKLQCDSWWEAETEWHRGWKSQFPVAWQEIVHFADDGEKHIADVRTGNGWVLEFQHSPLSIEERHARTTFYKRLNWVVDGTRRKRDISQFNRALRDGAPIGPRAPVMKVRSEGCRLLEEWADTKAPIFIDFGEPHRVWWLFSRGSSHSVYVAPYSRAEFVVSHRGENPEAARQFSAFVDELPTLIDNYEKQVATPPPESLPQPPGRYRRHFRF